MYMEIIVSLYTRLHTMVIDFDAERTVGGSEAHVNVMLT